MEELKQPGENAPLNERKTLKDNERDQMFWKYTWRSLLLFVTKFLTLVRIHIFFCILQLIIHIKSVFCIFTNYNELTLRNECDIFCGKIKQHEG